MQQRQVQQAQGSLSILAAVSQQGPYSLNTWMVKVEHL